VIGRLLDKTPRWLVVAAGFLTGIAILSLLLRRTMLTGEETTLGMYALVHFAGYLFFILSPVELLYIHMLGESEAGILTLYGLALGTALLAQLLDYAIGRAFSGTVIRNVIGEKKYRRHIGRIERYGGLTIFVFCLFPLSSPIVVLVAGIIRYPLRWVLALSAAGLALKYLALNLLFA
jgi:membrane protein DedA with SNARE-associated domain